MSCVGVCECASFPVGFEGGKWELVVLVPGHCLSFYFCYPSTAADDSLKSFFLFAEKIIAD